jgi:hypothetical protein
MRFLLIILLIGAAAGAYKAYEAQEKKTAAKEALRVAHEQLSISKTHLQTRQAELSQAQQVAAQLQAGTQEIARLTAQREELVGKATALTRTVTGLRDQVATAIDTARQAAVGKEFAALTLANGQTMRAVKIRSVNQSEVSVSHADGVGIITVDQLPQELRDRLGLGESTPLVKLEELVRTLNSIAQLGNGAPAAASDSKVRLSPLKSGEQRVHDLILTAPVRFAERDAGSSWTTVFKSMRASSGKSSNDLEVTVSKMVAKPGVQLDLERAAQSAAEGVMKLSGMHRSSHSTKATTAAGLPALQSTFSALRSNGTGGANTIYMESLYILRGDTAWAVQAIFSSLTTGNRPLVEEMFRSIRLD